MHLLGKNPHLIDVVILTSPAPRAERGGISGSQKSSRLSLPNSWEYLDATSHIMVVKIRLARFGRRRAPFYNIVVAQARFVLLSSTGIHFKQAQLTRRLGQRETANRLKSLVCPPISQLHYQSFNQRLGSESSGNG
jgi:hypothetical protein